jgi:flagellar capping protein FliD
MTYLEENTGYDPETKKMGVLSSELSLSFIRNQTRSPFIGVASGFAEQMDCFIRASDLGITFDGHGMMEFDKTELDNAIKEDFNAVLDLLAASAVGNSDNDDIQFYGSTIYTEPGEYNVKVQTDAAGTITDAWIKLASEDWTQARILVRDGYTLRGTGDYSSDDPEKGLQLVFAWDGVEHTSANPVEATIRVKRGVAATLDEVLDDILDANGQLDITSDVIDQKMKQTDETIQREESRLEGVEERLYAKYARLERTLSLLQQQYASAGILQMFE